MKAIGITIAGILALAFMFLMRTNEPPSFAEAASKTQIGVQQIGPVETDEPLFRGFADTLTSEPASNDLNQLNTSNANTQTIVLSGWDFRCEEQKTRLTDGFQRGSSHTSEDQAQSIRHVQVFVCAEQVSSEAFTALVPDMDGFSSADSDLTLEFRTKSVSGEWSGWRMIHAEDLKAPALLQSPATTWQYRIVLDSPDPTAHATINQVSATIHFPGESAGGGTSEWSASGDPLGVRF